MAQLKSMKMEIDYSLVKKQVSMVFLFQLLWLVILFLSYLSISNGVDKILIYFVLIHGYATIIRHLIAQSLRCGRSSRFVSLDMLFLFGCYLVYLLPYQLYLANIIQLDYSRFLLFNTYSAYSNAALILSSVCITSFSIGWEISAQKSAGIPKQQSLESEFLLDRKNDLITVRRLIRFNLTCLVFLLPVYQFSGFRSNAETRYGTSGNASVLGEALYFGLLLFSLLSFAAWIYLMSHSVKLDSFGHLAIVLSLLWQFRVLFVGDRNSFFLIAMVQLAGYSFFVKKPNTFFLSLFVFLSIYLYVVIENFRTVTQKNVTSFFEFGSFEKFSIFGESSLNITTISLRAMLQMYDESGELYFGFFKLIGILGIVPFSRGVFLPDSITITDTSQLVTSYIFGNQPHWQVGTSLVADSFIDFGFLGVILIPLIYGYIGARSQLKSSETRNVKVMILFLFLLATYLQLPRYSADFPIRMLIWTWLLLTLIEKSKKTRILE